jgi:hypothetical protein
MTNPFSKLAELQARARALKPGVSSVPTLNGASTSSLAFALARVAAAEANLESARVTARAAARQEGVKIVGLFEGSQFVWRATAERWRDEGIERGREETTAAYKMLLAPPSGEFAELAAAVRRAIAAGGFKDYLGGKKKGEAPADAAADLDPDALAEAEAAAKVEAEAKILAAKILAAGERARSDGSNERPAPTGRAKRILDVARAAHRRQGDDE